MNWEAINASAEMVGAIAVFISLVYLAVQVRQSTGMISSNLELSRLAAFEQNVQAGNAARDAFILNPEVAGLFLTGCRGLEQLTEVQRFRFLMLLRNLFSSMQGAYVRQLTLTHDPDEFSGTASVIDELLANPGIRQFVRGQSHDWRPEFRELVEQRLARFAD